MGDTTFHFVPDGLGAALQMAREAAGHKDVRIGGGVETVRQALQAGMVDEMHLAFSPVLLGRGENLFHGLDLPALGYEVAEHVPTAAATHVVFTRRAS
jgi:dihydrofolate reductase